MYPRGVLRGVLQTVKQPSGGGSVTWIKTANPAVQASGATSFTFSAQALGSAAADRLTVVIVNTHTAVATAVTVGGLSATKAVEESAAISGLQIWYVDTNALTTSEDIVVSSGATMTNVVIQVGKLTGAVATPTATQSANNGASDPSTITATVPSSGVGLAAIATSVAVTGSWANATEDYNSFAKDTNDESLVLANTTTAGSQTPSYSSLGGGNSHMVMACWGP